MKEVKMFMTETCPHCKKAFSLMEEICREHPEYETVKIEKIDETKEADYAAKFDYYYVPTFYVGGVKIHEGSPTKEALERVYAEAVK
jgi:glutaredoxin